MHQNELESLASETMSNEKQEEGYSIIWITENLLQDKQQQKLIDIHPFILFAFIKYISIYHTSE